jgi:hypothetical protein
MGWGRQLAETRMMAVLPAVQQARSAHNAHQRCQAAHGLGMI